jgi:hypothetical protein
VTGKRVLLLIGIASAVLLIAGFVVGAVGSEIFGLGKPFVKQPEIHLAIQPVFPAEARDAALGYGNSEEKNGAARREHSRFARLRLRPG